MNIIEKAVQEANKEYFATPRVLFTVANDPSSWDVENAGSIVCASREDALEATRLFTKLQTELVAARRDAERYRWLRSEEACTNPKYYAFWREFGSKLCREKKMDAAIDAALSAKEKA